MIRYRGLNSTASLEEREKLLVKLKQDLPSHYVLLSTCNRVELYYGDGNASPEIMRHLFQVVSGLDSQLLGENAIQGQVKRAYLDAIEDGHISKGLHRLFQNALRVGKEVRTLTRINHGAMSHSQGVVEILERNLKQFAEMNVTILGVNALTESIIQFLKRKMVHSIFLGNRTLEKAELVAKVIDAKAFQLKALGQVMQRTDVLISSTSAPHHIVKPDHIPSDRSITIIDLAVPRDVHPLIGQFTHIDLYNIYDIETLLKVNEEGRQHAKQNALSLIEKHLHAIHLEFKGSFSGQKDLAFVS